MGFGSIRPDQRVFLTAVIGAYDMNRPSSGMVFLLGNTPAGGELEDCLTNNLGMRFWVLSRAASRSFKEHDEYVSRQSKVV